MPKVLVMLCILLLCGRASYAQDKRITVAPAALSFPQLAKQLSTDGRTVFCASDLKECAGFVALKDREWNQAMRLLGEGLAVRFVPVENAVNTWRMERDPVVLAREGRFRKQLFRNIENEFERGYGILKRFSLRDYPRAAAQEKYLQQLQSDYDQSHPHMDIPERYKDPVYKEIMRQRTENGRLSPHFPEIWLAAALYHSGKLGSVEQSFRSGETVTVLSLRELDGLFGGFPPPEYQLNPAFPAVVAVLRTRIYPNGIYSQIDFHQPDPVNRSTGRDGSLRWHSRNSITTLFLGDKGQDYLSKLSLGKEAEVWFQRECKAMESFLLSPRSEGVIRSKDNLPFADISLLIEAWCRSQNAEAIMELFPAREVINEPTLGYNRERGPAVGTRPEELPEEDRKPPRHNLPWHPLWEQQVGQGTTLRAVFQDNLIGNHGHWTLRDSNDVLIVTNRLAFLDRPRPYPLAAFLRLEAKWKEYMAAGGGEYLLLDETAADYLQTVSKEQNALWLRLFDRQYYRRVPMEDIAVGIPVLRLWQTLPQAKRREVLASVKGNRQSVFVSASEFEPRALEELERAMRCFGLSTNYRVWMPDNLSMMQQGKLQIKIREIFDKEGLPKRTAYTLSFLSARDGVASHGAFILSDAPH